MKNLTYLLLSLLLIFSACSRPDPQEEGDFVLVKGGAFVNKTSNLYGKGAAVPDFYISKYEVTQKEWMEVMDGNPSKFKGDDLPVETVSWYDCIEYCNKRSTKEGFAPFYNIGRDTTDPENKNEFDSVKWVVTINEGANGYRLPTETEWEYAAGGGQLSNSFIYSGSNDINEVAWYWQNSGDSVLTGTWHWTNLENNNCRTNPVGAKAPNELGLYDMSGNVREWCEDWFVDHEVPSGQARVQRGGGWIGGEVRCETANRHSFDASGKGPDQGFRLCRSVAGS